MDVRTRSISVPTAAAKSAAHRICAAMLAVCILASLPVAHAAAENVIAVSPSVVAEYNRFRQVGLPGYFAVSDDGRGSGFSFCRNDEECGAAVEALALQFCREARPNSSCLTFAKSQDLVAESNFSMPADTDVALAEKGWLTFAAEMNWPGYAEGASGWVLIPPGDHFVGTMRFVPVDDGSAPDACLGAYSAIDMAHGSWTMACPAGMAASGTYKRLKTRWVSKGSDLAGQPVTMTTFFK